MSDFSLVPVDHQPDFADVSLIPVDHNPFSADGAIQVAGAQPQSQSQPLATGDDLPEVGAPAIDAQAAAFDKSTVDWSRYNQPYSELKAATYTPTQHISNLAADLLMGLGAQPYTANDLTSRVGNVLGLSPLGVAGSVLDLIDAKRRGNLGEAAVAASGMIPGARGIARGVGEEAGAAVRAVVKGAEVQFAQRGISPNFHENGDFAGRSIDDVAAELRNGTMSADQLPLRVITRDGVTYTLNNRSLMALRQGGQEPTILNDVTGDPLYERVLTKRLNEIGSNAGPNFVPPIRRK